MKLTLLGAGAWGTALSIAFAGNHEVTLWSRETDVAVDLKNTRENRRFFPGYRLPDNVAVETDFAAAVSAAELLIIATPIAGLRPTVEQLRALDCQAPLLWVCKGFEAGTGKLAHQVVGEVLGRERICGALSGPSFAEEVAAAQPTAVALAANDPAFARATARQLHSTRLRIYANDDLVGVEVGGAVKNVLAIATGMADGMALGLNARAALITRGLAEMTRLGLALGGRAETFMGLSGLGDLVLTATGDLSRNRRVGLKLAEGQTLERILVELGHVSEGVYSAGTVLERATALGVDMPITRAVVGVLQGEFTPREAVQALMQREARAES